MMELVIAGGAVVAAAHVISERLLRDSTVEEMGILLDSMDTSSLLASGWGEEDFSAFSGAEWGMPDRDFYMLLSRRMKASRYGRSRALLRGLVRIEDQRQQAKGDSAADDASYTERAMALLSSYGKTDGFEGFLARFLIKRHQERVGDGAGG